MNCHVRPPRRRVSLARKGRNSRVGDLDSTMRQTERAAECSAAASLCSNAQRRVNVQTTMEAEAQLLARCRRGDADAWDELFDRHYAAAGRFVFQLASDFTREDTRSEERRVGEACRSRG